MRLLILTCSARKRGPAAPCPVIERYDGPLWQVVRRFQREQPLFAAELVVYGLSAAFGLIPSIQRIPYYDQTMDAAQADALHPQVLSGFAALMGGGYTHVCLGLSDRYLRAMKGWETLVPTGVTATVTDGPLGTKLAQLCAWLDDRVWTPEARPTHLAAPETPCGTVMIAGVQLQMSREEALAQGRVALAANDAGARRYRDWYVLLDGQPVAAKWLVSVLSGLPTSRFDAANARRVLLALGLDVERAG